MEKALFFIFKLRYQYKSTNTDAEAGGAGRPEALESCLVFEKGNVFNEALSLRAVLVLCCCFTVALLGQKHRD